MIRIYKDELGTDGAITNIKGKIRKILTAQFQPGAGPCIWYEVDDDVDEIELQIICLGTGWELPETLKYLDYIGTVQDGLGFVWHYYVKPFNNINVEKELGNIFGALFGGKE